ncbi:hypothetical protein OEG84_25240 [Hoeflea sp. G2-23]|uniref:Uncharacterized protein n=1 Tax=Hoeflea algicola TaxID=2983763 RepID=A0ABT3ZGI2_9HYPH|nr:hypothetical protein [Hoeflea algicola]MCY0150598.1 hypothetical protein [Hoeflea algicola]MCY0150914.1 hypothetical protein [Hoeflea algicola]
MNKEALSFKTSSLEWRSNQPNPNFNNPRETSLCAPVDLTAAGEVEGFHAFNRARARSLITTTAHVMRRGEVA